MRTLLKPKWVAGHLLVVVVVVAFANLGAWQLRRHDWRAERNERIAQGLAQEAAPFASLPEKARAYRPVTVSGRYEHDADVLLTPRNELGPGHHVLTPLVLDDGTALLVDRGWVPFRHATPPVPGAEPPSGRVILQGVLLPAAEAPPQGTREGGRLVRVRAVDPRTVLGAALGEEARTRGLVADVFLLLRGQQPAPGQLPVPGPLPEQDAGPHLSYAIQWFLFAAVVVAGYPMLLRRAVREASDDDAGLASTVP